MSTVVDTLDKLAKLYGIETNQELEQRLSKMSKEEMKQELGEVQ